MLLYDKETGQCADSSPSQQNIYSSAITGPLNLLLLVDDSLYTNLESSVCYAM